MSDWRAIPKTELHLHLEGAAPPDFIRVLAAEKKLDLGNIFAPGGHYRWRDFADFLTVYQAACQALQTPQDYYRLTQAVLEKSAEDGVIYTEIFIAPDIFAGGDHEAFPDFLSAITEAAAAARDGHGIEARFIAVAIRNFGGAAALRAAQTAVAHKGHWLTGWGLAAEERMGHASDFVAAFSIAAEAGLGITAHAGELVGAESVAATLDFLPVSRIGHGVRAIEDPRLVRRLADEGVVLEVNPGSNVALKVFHDWPSHPIDRLRRAGVKVTVSTDDPPYWHTDMVHEYAMLARTFGWTEADFRAINRTAMDAAFCDDATRARIRARFEEAPQ